MAGPETKIAIVGMAGRFPGAGSTRALWEDVVQPGTEQISFFSPEEGDTLALIDEGDGSEEDPGEGEWVGAQGVLEDPEYFDHEFFDMSPAEVRRTDPQHRLFLECVWEALEDCGTDITEFDGYTSVYGSCDINTSYAFAGLDSFESGRDAQIELGQMMVGNDKDYLTTRVAYKLDLRGECITVQTACSSSLVAVHLASQSLMTGQSDLAIAGGVSVDTVTGEEKQGYYQQGGYPKSSDGHCKAFTDVADGIVGGEGVGVVTLMRLEDALADAHTIYGVISGSAVNNDGSQKVGYAAPSVEGQVAVMRDAMAFSGVAPDEIDYVECHGTGTELGDAIELRALERVFGEDRSEADEPVYLGSVKPNIGHLGSAAGISSLIKTAMALHSDELPALLFVDEYDVHPLLEKSDYLAVSGSSSPWEPGGDEVRRASINSLGLGGTNAHLVLEEAPDRATDAPERVDRPGGLLVWSGKSSAAAEAYADGLADWFESSGEEHRLDDVAFTLQRGRAAFEERRAMYAATPEEAISNLRRGEYERSARPVDEGSMDVAFMFPGSGAYFPEMADELRELESPYKRYFEQCRSVLSDRAGFDLFEFLDDEQTSDLSQRGSVERFAQRQAAVVSVEWSLARTLIDWGCRPDAMIGSSLGEYTAACVGGAISLEETLELVYRRAELLAELGEDDEYEVGEMSFIHMSFDEIQQTLPEAERLEEAIRVSPSHTIVSGPGEVVRAVESKLEEDGVQHRRLEIEGAGHSSVVEPVRDPFLEQLSSLDLEEPEIPFVSNRSGEIIGSEEVRASEYWYEQMRHTVRLGEGMRTLFEEGVRVFLEVGPGLGLSKFAAINLADEEVVIDASLPHPKSDAHDWSALAGLVGTAWANGAAIEWQEFGTPGRRIPLPSYAFDKYRFVPSEDEDAAPEVSGDEGEEASEEPEFKRREDRVSPRNPLEERVSEIWTEVLQVEDIGIRENFFDLGGDSLEATKIVSRVQTELAPELTIEDVLEHRTVEELAQVVEEKARGEVVGDDTDQEGDEEEYHCRFEMEIGGEKTTVHMTREEYETEGVPDGAENLEFLGDD